MSRWERASKRLQEEKDNTFICIATWMFGLRLANGEAVDFNEATLAETLRMIVKSQEMGLLDERSSLRALRVIADALDDPTAFWALKVARNKVGTPVNINKIYQKGNLEKSIAISAWKKSESIKKMEAIVSEVGAEFGVSRASVFKALKATAVAFREEHWEWLRQEGKADDTELKYLEIQYGPQYTQFANWLDRFHPSKRAPTK